MPPHSNSQLNQKQTISFLVHHLESLKTLANKISSGKKQYCQLLHTPQLIRLQILESVTLMEKKICFSIENRSSLQFEDYITQFYEEELAKLRQELVTAGGKIAKLQYTLKEMNQLPTSQNGSHFSSNHSPLSQLSIIQQRQVSIKLKKQLTHCQSLIQQNQQFINQQSQVVKELTQQIHSIQEREYGSRMRYEESVMKYEKKVKENCDRFREMQGEFVKNRKVYEKQLKQLQLTNSRLTQQKSTLQQQLTTKSQQITLLANKIYDLQLTMTKYERQLSSKMSQNMQSDEALLLMSHQIKIWKQKFHDVENNMKGRVMNVEEERRLMEEGKRELVKEIDQLKRKIAGYQVNEVSGEKKMRQIEDNVSEKLRKIDQLQSLISDLQTKNSTLQTSIKQLQKQLSSINTQCKEQLQHISNLQSFVKQQKQHSQSIVQKNNQEKARMKKEIYHEVEELLKINEETVKRVKVQEHRIRELTEEIDQKQRKTCGMQGMMKKLQAVNEQVAKRNQAAIRELIEYKQVKQELQHKLQQTTLQLQQMTKFKSLSKQQQIQITTLTSQLTQHQQTHTLLQKQFQQLSKTIQTKQFEQSNQKYLTQQISLLKQQISLLKQQICRKDFMIKQLQAKINLLQEQLRQTQEATQVERERMGLKIRELEDLVKERYDFSNRPSNS